MATKPAIKFDRNADCPNMTELAVYLLERIEAIDREKSYNQGNTPWLTRLDGLRAAFETVLSVIGYEEDED